MRRALALCGLLVASGALAQSEFYGPTQAGTGLSAGSTVDQCVQSDVLLGTNLSGAEFGQTHLPGTFSSNYTYPITQEFDYFIKDKKMRLIRIPFLWERIQQAANGALDSAELGRLTSAVNAITTRGGYAILDVHNYARYFGVVLGGVGGVPNETFADLWTRLTNAFANNPNVWFGLMNEPHGMPTEQWRDAAQAAVTAIRNAEATALVPAHEILLPGNGFTGAHTWLDNTYGTPNSDVMPTVVDPAGPGYMAYEVHQYADSDNSGTHTSCVNSTIFSSRLAAFTTWARSQGAKAFIGEFGVPNNSTCLAAEADLLAFMTANSDVYIGATIWSAGPWWGNYFLNVEPNFTTVPITSAPQVNLMNPYACKDTSSVFVAPVSSAASIYGATSSGRAVSMHMATGATPGLLSPVDWGTIHTGIPVVGLQTTASSRISYTSSGASFSFSTNKLNVASAAIADGGASLLVNFVADVGSADYPCYADSAPPTTGAYIWYCYETTNTTLKLRATSRSNGSDVALSALGNFGVSFYVGK